MVAHAHGRWSDFGDTDNPSIPSAITDAARSANSLLASDGKVYTRQGDGLWFSDGIVFDRQANRNLSDELETTWHSQNAGIAQLNRMAEQVRDSVQIAPGGIRGLVETLYAKHGIERSEEQLAAITTALEQHLPAAASGTSISLELMPDAHSHAPGPDSAIAIFGSTSSHHMELIAATTMDDVARLQLPDAAPPTEGRAATRAPTRFHHPTRSRVHGRTGPSTWHASTRPDTRNAGKKAADVLATAARPWRLPALRANPGRCIGHGQRTRTQL